MIFLNFSYSKFKLLMFFFVFVYCIVDYKFYDKIYLDIFSSNANFNLKLIDIFHFLYNFLIFYFVYLLFNIFRNFSFNNLTFSTFLVFLSINDLLPIFYNSLNLFTLSFPYYSQSTINIITSIFFLYFEKKKQFEYFTIETNSEIVIETLDE